MIGREWWDVLDVQGDHLRERHLRDSGELDAGRFHLVAVTCAVRHDGHLLLTCRAASKEFPGMWELPGGSALAGETGPEAAARELREETGLTVGTDDLLWISRFTEQSAHVDLFVVPVPARQVVRADPAEVSDTAWVDLPELERRRRCGLLAAPWDARLAAFTTGLAAGVATVTS